MSQRFDKGCSSENPVLGTASFRPELRHVAQQSRRDKLRVQHQFGATQEPRNLDPNPNTDLIHVRHIRNCDSLYNSPMLPSSGILDFSTGNESSSFVNSSTSTFHQPSCDWIMNCVGGPISNTHSLFPSHLYNLRPGVSSYQDLSNELSSQENPKPYGELHFSSPQFYQNTLQELVTSSSSTLGNQGLQMVGQLSPWVDQRQLQQFNSEGEFTRAKVEGSFNAVASETQGLSLSLSSKPPSELHATHLDVGFSYPNPKFSIGASSMDPHRAAGPLGPFTGYATILKSSKFLKPAQQLLDEFCSVVIASSKVVKQQYDHVVERGNSAGGSGANCNGGVGDDGVNGGRGGNSGVSSSSFYSSTAGSGDGGADGGANCQIHGPEIQQKKVKLLYMQEEVCRRYKQYHQQMQMVASSFESVAGLSAATPYTSLALKTVSKNFRSLKNAISDQLRHVGKVLGEDFMSSPSSSSRGETMPTPRLKYIDQGLRKQKASENNSLCFLDNNQPVWRPQRGLPERAVAVLRAWLFEHFLHPYPTDTDKHVLATQTGLSRNQVSNWFINARVRLWKPMVEEIHMLESKGMAEADLNSTNKNQGKSIRDDDGQACDQESEAQSNKPSDCSSKGPVANESSSISMEQWHQEKRSRMEECTIPGSMDGGLMSFAYQGGMDIGGLGAVSLTLGLRHHEDTQQQQQQFRHFGSQMLHDFVG